MSSLILDRAALTRCAVPNCVFCSVDYCQVVETVSLVQDFSAGSTNR